MKKLRILAKIVACLIIVIVLGLSAIYVWSERILDQVYDIPPSAYDVRKDSLSIVQGKRLTTIYHCDGCHGKALTGQVFLQIKNVATLVAPNLTRVLPTYSDAELERAIRHGVFKNGKASWMFASSSFYYITDSDLGKIVGYLRTVPEASDSTAEKTSIGILGRLGIVLGKFVPPAMVINHNDKRLTTVTASETGEYLTTSLCSGCHGKNYQGVPEGVPSLLRVKSYSRSQFVHLLNTGEGVTRKDLTTMSEMCVNHFTFLTDTEMESIHDYLQGYDFNN